MDCRCFTYFCIRRINRIPLPPAICSEHCNRYRFHHHGRGHRLFCLPQQFLPACRHLHNIEKGTALLNRAAMIRPKRSARTERWMRCATDSVSLSGRGDTPPARTQARPPPPSSLGADRQELPDQQLRPQPARQRVRPCRHSSPPYIHRQTH